jgi:TM2 domain
MTCRCIETHHSKQAIRRRPAAFLLPTDRADADGPEGRGPGLVTSDVSDKSRTVALLLAALLGPFGAHRFYTGHTRSGILMAVTLGGAGIWYLYDLIVVAAGDFRDVEGRRVSDWEIDERPRPDLSPDVLLELDQLRQEVAELSERVDFTERLLANQRRDQLQNPSTQQKEGGSH